MCFGNVAVKAAPGPLTNYYLYLLQNPAPVNQGTAYNLIIQAKDALNNTVSSGGSVNLTSTDPNAIKPTNTTITINSNGVGTCTFYFGTPGSQTITVTDNTIITVTGTLAVTVSPIHFDISVTPTTIVANQSVSVSVSALDASNNVQTSLGNSGYGNALSFDSSDSQAIFPNQGLPSDLVNGVGVFNITLPTAGLQTITVINKAFPLVNATTSTITVNPQPTASASSSPEASSSPSPSAASTSPGQSSNPTATLTGTTTATPGNPAKQGGNNQALVIGIVVAIIVIVVAFAVYFLKKTKSQNSPAPQTESTPHLDTTTS